MLPFLVSNPDLPPQATVPFDPREINRKMGWVLHYSMPTSTVEPHLCPSHVAILDPALMVSYISPAIYRFPSLSHWQYHLSPDLLQAPFNNVGPVLCVYLLNLEKLEANTFIRDNVLHHSAQYYVIHLLNPKSQVFTTHFILVLLYVLVLDYVYRIPVNNRTLPNFSIMTIICTSNFRGQWQCRNHFNAHEFY